MERQLLYMPIYKQATGSQVYTWRGRVYEVEMKVDGTEHPQYRAAADGSKTDR